MQTTSSTFLDQMSNSPNKELWDQFYAFYAPVIHGFCARKCVPVDQCDDICQQVMIKLAKKLSDFKYDRSKGRFRGYIICITMNVIKDEQRKYAKQQEMLKSDDMDLMLESIAPEGPSSIVGDIDDDEWRMSILRAAAERVRNSSKATEQGWRIFESYVLEEQDAEDVAQSESVKVNTVYQTKKRMIERITEEARKILAAGDALELADA